MWDSVFWHDENARPDKVTDLLNQAYSKCDEKTKDKVKQVFDAGFDSANSESQTADTRAAVATAQALDSRHQLTQNSKHNFGLNAAYTLFLVFTTGGDVKYSNQHSNSNDQALKASSNYSGSTSSKTSSDSSTANHGAVSTIDEKETLRKALDEAATVTQFTGEKFIPKELHLKRLNLSAFKGTSSLTVSQIKITRTMTELSSKINILPPVILARDEPEPVPVTKVSASSVERQKLSWNGKAAITDGSKVTTILLLGESGVGKSTFINAFANYLCHENLAEAESKELFYLIPSHFTMYDDDHNAKKITVGKFDRYEADGTGVGTQFPQCYVFAVGDTIINMIDTPGIGEGPQRDGKNMRNLLDFLRNYEEINAICILLKPNNAKISCILELLANLNKSASRSILFLFTNSRGTFYKPGDTGPALRTMLDQINSEDVEIPFTQKNTFCLDNEAFRFLMAKSPPNNVRFTEQDAGEFAASWARSVAECERMMMYINELPPHPVADTTSISISKARTLIQLLTKPLAEIAQNIVHNVELCEAHRHKIREFQGDIETLTKELYTPTETLTSIPLDAPMTVCGDERCCAKITVADAQMIHYPSPCHNPCHLTNTDHNIIGNTGLLDCQAFNTYTNKSEYKLFPADSVKFHPDFRADVNEKGEIFVPDAVRRRLKMCLKCGHSYMVHLHVTTRTERRLIQVKNEALSSRITSKEEAKNAKELHLQSLENKVAGLRRESIEINKCVAMFACFLFNNAITPFNDAYEDYLGYLIATERKSSSAERMQNEANLKATLDQYKVQKEEFFRPYKKNDKNKVILPRAIEKAVDKLLNLEINGPVIRSHMDVLQRQKENLHFMVKEVRASVSLRKPKRFLDLF
ncbi:hypothetical protein BV898_01015 [Hypsibius exemplaris]|uniref:Uncharacterized protein n=1 Tax=Hypsibius exemplaris TaxID=2072580 RepID=A0A1W0XCX2_HYPEX|nr:hypothetical protein BV898_01015 [Hypsibius exemplaris]